MIRSRREGAHALFALLTTLLILISHNVALVPIQFNPDINTNHESNTFQYYPETWPLQDIVLLRGFITQ